MNTTATMRWVLLGTCVLLSILLLGVGVATSWVYHHCDLLEYVISGIVFCGLFSLWLLFLFRCSDVLHRLYQLHADATSRKS